MDEYTQLLYVNQNGSDSTGDGSLEKPFASIPYTITKINTLNPLITIGEGEFKILTLPSLSKSECTVNIKGTNQSTKLIVLTGGMTSYLGKLNISNFIITADDNFYGDIRSISYTTDINAVIFRNVLFLKSNNMEYPTTWWFVGHNSNTSGKMNKSFYNCTFTSTLQVFMNGISDFINCATESSIFGKGESSTSNINCILDSQYRITNYDNSLVGIYSGENKWSYNRYLIKQNNKYYDLLEDGYKLIDVVEPDTTTFKSSSITNVNQLNINSIFNNIGDNIKLVKWKKP